MISTGKFKLYGPLEEMADGYADIQAFAYQGGKIVPVEQEEESTTPVFHVADEKVY